MGLKQKTADLKKRMREAIKGGGSEAIEKQKAIGKLTARERIYPFLMQSHFTNTIFLLNMQAAILTWTKSICRVMV